MGHGLPQADPPAVQLDHAVDDRQAQPGTRLIRRKAGETLKRVAQLVVRDAGAIVGNGKHRPALPVGSQFDADMAARWGGSSPEETFAALRAAKDTFR